MRPNGGWSGSETQNMQASIGQYSIQAGEPAQPVQQSVVIARIRGRFLRVSFPSPTDIGQCLSTMSNVSCSSRAVMWPTLTQTFHRAQSPNATGAQASRLQSPLQARWGSNRDGSMHAYHKRYYLLTILY